MDYSAVVCLFSLLFVAVIMGCELWSLKWLGVAAIAAVVTISGTYRIVLRDNLEP
jgi:hypothetical protein